MALYIAERVRGRKELVMRVLDPPFHTMPADLAEGVRVEDCVGGGGGGGVAAGVGGGAGAGAGGAAAGAAQRSEKKEGAGKGGKRKRQEE